VNKWGKLKKSVKKEKAQSHLCICNNYLIDDTIINGVYGFPHAGKNKLKSFWRSISGLCNIGEGDLIFLYRTNGKNPGTKEVHGPFRVSTYKGKPAIYYDQESVDYPMRIKGKTDCQSRFLFTNIFDEVYSISDKYEFIKKYETKEIWGYRHPAVMNIGAARKKSITSMTTKQTLAILDLFEKYGTTRSKVTNKIPAVARVKYISSLKDDPNHYIVNDDSLLRYKTKDEAALYAYIIYGLKNPGSRFHTNLIKDFSTINKGILKSTPTKSFKSLARNIMQEVIISPHLQDELDIVFQDSNDKVLLFLEIKSGNVDQDTVEQAERYIDFLKIVFPEKEIRGNLIGASIVPGTTITPVFVDQLEFVTYIKKTKADGTKEIRFQKETGGLVT
jgi:hypothetical protein